MRIPSKTTAWRLAATALFALLFFAVPWRDLAREVLPDAWAPFYCKAGTDGDSTTYALHLEQPLLEGRVALDKVWLDHDKPGLLRISGRFIGVDPRKTFGITARLREAADGFENGICGYVPLPEEPENTVPFILDFANPPVAASRLYVRIYYTRQSGGSTALEALSEFSFPNPLRRAPRPWQAEPLPASRDASPLKVELLKLETDLPGTFVGDCFSRLTLRLLEGDTPTQKWGLVDAHFSASSGASSLHYFGFTPEKEDASGQQSWRVGGTLWKADGPWKVRLRLARHNDFRPDEIITIPDIPVPEEGQAIPDGRAWTVAGRSIPFAGVGRGTHKLADGDEIKSSPGAIFLHFRQTNETRDCYLRPLALTDEQGNELWHGNEYRRINMGERHVIQTSSFSFLLPREKPLPKKLTLKLGVIWEEREAEFTVLPTFSGETCTPKVAE